jgi:hypothetical protein
LVPGKLSRFVEKVFMHGTSVDRLKNEQMYKKGLRLKNPEKSMETREERYKTRELKNEIATL